MRPCRGTGEPWLDGAVTAIAALPESPPGVLVAVSSGGVVQWSAHGAAQVFDERGPLAEPPPIDLLTMTDLGSVTKVVGTTAALMALLDDGRLDLRTQVGELVPSVAGTPAGAASAAQLLQHRAGLWEWWPTYLSGGDPLATIGGLPLRYQPEEDRHYSDLGFMLLGTAVAGLTGSPLDVAVRDLVLRPIGLRTVGFGVSPGQLVAASSCGDAIEREMVRTGHPYPVLVEPGRFDGWRDHILVGEVNDGNAFHSFSSVAGHAGLFGTGADLLRFGDGLLACLRGQGFVAPATVRTFLLGGVDAGQALGFRRWRIGSTTAWGHTGFPGVALAILPTLQCSVIMVTNRLHVRGTPMAVEPAFVRLLSAVAEEGDLR